jgi:hypothetical protein
LKIGKSPSHLKMGTLYTGNVGMLDLILSEER